VTDTEGNLLALVTHMSEDSRSPLPEDCFAIACRATDGAPGLIAQAYESFPDLVHIFADGGYAGDTLKAALAAVDGPTIEIVRRSPGVTDFAIVARRWAVDRTFSWLGQRRRLAKDWETSIASSDAWALIAEIQISTQYIAIKNTQ
jgi:transposase